MPDSLTLARPSALVAVACLVAVGALGQGPFPQAVVRRLSPDVAAIAAGGGEQVSFALAYTTIPSVPYLGGLGLRVHWDSSKLTFAGLTGLLEASFVGASLPQVDIEDGDDDPATDMIVIAGWVDLEGAWPGDLPATLLTAAFTADPSFSGTTWVRFSPAGVPAEDVVEAEPVTVSQRFWQRFDFGTATSPVAPGFVRVSGQSAYAPELEFGWLGSPVAEHDRGVGDDLGRDLNATSDGTFVVDLGPGAYLVTLTFGDSATGHDRMRIELEGAIADTVTTRAGELVRRSYGVTVTDRQLTVRLVDLGGDDGVAVVSALEIGPATDGARISVFDGEAGLADAQSRAVDFGTTVAGAAEPTRSLLIRNDGGRPLFVTPVTLSGGFALSQGIVGEVGPGGTTSLNITMPTDAPGIRQGTLVLETNDADETFLTIPLRGAVRRKPGPRRVLH